MFFYAVKLGTFSFATGIDLPLVQASSGISRNCSFWYFSFGFIHSSGGLGLGVACLVKM